MFLDGKYSIFIPLPMKYQTLLEVSMTPSTLEKFINSPQAKGIRAGFEAELCYAGVTTSYNSQYKKDDVTPSFISDIIEFFEDTNSQSVMSRIERDLNSDYQSYADELASDAWYDNEEENVSNYIIEWEWDEDAEIETILADVDIVLDDVLIHKKNNSQEWQAAADEANDKLIELINRAIAKKNHMYDDAYENFVSKFNKAHSVEEHDFLEWSNIYTMSDVQRKYSLIWPSDNNVTEFNVDAANDVATAIESAIGVTIEVGDSYDSVDRTDTNWILEADPSIEVADIYNDLGAELISPPMELPEFFDKLKKFLTWATKSGAYANVSTGFHVGVSLPSTANNIDYVKLVMFLGDEHLLEKFGRENNRYCAKAATTINRSLAFTKNISSDDTIAILNNKLASIFDLLKDGCVEIASSLVATSNTDKYTSINMREGYIEFRIGGNVNYIDKFDTIKNSIYRYAYAMTIAADSTAYKQEYSKKLYKFLTKNAKNEASTMGLLARYVSGTISAVDVKSMYSIVADERPKNSAPNIPGAKPPVRK